MKAETINPTNPDQQAVEAVRRGDAARYRELVERHERRVYAVAWSRLGDAALAEEATQEAFIRAYRHLALLADASKFSGWISSITRHVAIGLGLRHRRELNKRERWALEQPATTEPPDEESELCTPETLRQTLAELPPSHRECLVLFYLEGKSGVEAAASLGISESALRVRLHRARAALRERLEERLGESLEKIRPAKPIAPSVMAAILSSSTAKAAGGTGAGIGVTILSALGKVLPFKFILLFFWLVGALPSLAFAWWMGRLERRNYRDAAGFRPRLHREFYRRQLLMIAIILLVSWGIIFPIIRMSDRLFGGNGFFLALGLVSLALAGLSARRFTICRNRFQVTMFVYIVVLTAGELSIGLGLLSPVAFDLFLALGMVPIAAGFRDRPLRMDYNLFLRAVQGMLGTSAANVSSKEPVVRLPASQLRAFARFLGTRWLIVNYRWEEQDLTLRLTGVNHSWRGFYYFGKSGSWITLAVDGTVSAHLGDRDERHLRSLSGHLISSRPELQTQVALAVERAWRCFREGDLAAAERAVGQVSESEVFVTPLARATSTRLYVLFTMAVVVLMLALGSVRYFKTAGLGGLKPVNVTEPEIRAALAGLGDNASTNRSMDGDLMYGLTVNLVLPPTNYFTPGALQAVQREIFKFAGFDPHRDGEYRFVSLRDRSYFNRAMLDGWIGWNDLGITPDRMEKLLRRPEAATSPWRFMLTRRSCWVDGKTITVERMDHGRLSSLRWLRDLNCLDLVGRSNLIEQIRSVQVLSNVAPAGEPPIQDWKSVRGLFLTRNYPMIQDTYYNLAALEILGGLDKIDREACIQGILRLYRGKGLFRSPVSMNVSFIVSFIVAGDARDTFCAFESLRILGALDRVKDLDRWQFCPLRASKPGAPRKVTWEEIEAWVCQQRLKRVLREYREHPQAPVRSLLEP
jgi:RNA polymerase sigma-70 factor (ECF subfamily)